MPTLIGKLFVFLVFTLSLGFLAMAIGVYTSHINWKKGGDAKTDGVIDKYEAKIKEFSYSRDRADARIRQAYNELGRVEFDRAARRQFHGGKYNMLLTGKDHKGQVLDAPVQQLEIDAATGLLRLNVVGPTVVQVRGGPLRHQEFYRNALAVRDKSIREEQAVIKSEQDKLDALTIEMQGNAAGPGLIRQKELMVEAKLKARSEQEFLKPSLANRFAEATLLLKRETGLRQRLQELERAPTSVGRND